MAISKGMLEGLKQQLGYNDAQWELWKSDPKNLEVVGKMEEFGKYKVVAEVIKAYGCAMEHKVGDKLIFSGLGGFISKEPPGQVCVGALGPVLPFVSNVLGKIAEGADPEKVLFNKIRCTDVGVENGGWGEVLMEIRVEKT